jgi:serine phosphatase RsbU (regulator of sigma subunit)/anti-sigma regulatory factor (Ser/Thr protein kinase)
MRARIRTQAFLVGVLPLSFLIVLLVLGLMVQRSSQFAGSLEQRTQLALGHVDGIRRELEEASRTAGTYPLRKDAIRRLADARRRVNAHLTQMRPMVADRPDVAQRVDVFSSLTRGVLDLLDRYASLISAHKLAAARALAREPSSRTISLRWSSAFDSLVNRERADELAQLVALRDHTHRVVIGLIAACAAGIVLTLLVSARFGLAIAERLGQLAENARRLARGEAVSPVGGNDEFTDLDMVYQAMMRQIQREQQLNSRLQRMLLPEHLPDFDGIRIDTSYVPAAQENEVGGDWYDAFTVADRRICISIGDVAGHGLRAAAVMASARIAVRTAARMETDPSKIVAHLNRVMCADEPGTLVTAFVALLDIDDGTLRYAVAGHPEPMIIQTEGTAEMLGGRGLVLGVDENATYQTFETRMNEGSALLLYTDGLIEVGKDYFAGVDELRKAACEEFSSSAHNIAEAIQQRVFHGRPTDDDAAVLFLCVTHLGKQTEGQTWSLDARDAQSAHRAKRAILWHIGNMVHDESQLAAIELVLGELIGNVARHSPGDAKVRLERAHGRTLLRVCDGGKPFSYHPDGAVDPLAESGRGLFLARTIAHDVRVEHDGTGNIVTAEFR